MAGTRGRRPSVLISLYRPMSQPTKRSLKDTPPSGWAVPIAKWQEEVARSRERLTHLTGEHRAPGSVAGGARSSDDSSLLDDSSVLEELSTTFEELSVADEELRAQNEQLTEAYSRLEHERERYHALFQRAPVAYLVTDVVGVISKANLAAGTLLGSRSDWLVGKPLSVFLDAASRQRFRNTLSAIAAGELESVTVALGAAPHGAVPIRLEAMIDVTRLEGDEVSELRWLLVDQTQHLSREESERRRATELEALVARRTEELERTQRLKDQLIATVSHEFRTALSAIGGYTELLTMGLRGPLSDEQKADMDRIQRANHHLAILVDDLLSYSKITAGQMVFQFENVLLVDALNGLVDLVAPQALARGIALDASGISNSPRTVMIHSDSERVRQIILNLLSNAVKFTRPGGVVSLDWSEDGRDAFVAVMDNGPGIPRDKHEAIFQPFVRLGSNTAIAGSGLGLAISREMARALGGDVTVTSELGSGARFVLRLPLSTRLAGDPSRG